MQEDKEKIIANYMRTLDLTREEAEQLYQDDNSDEVLPEVKIIEEKAKQLKHRYEFSGKERKPSKRERKVDEIKKDIFEKIKSCLNENNIEIINEKTETEISFIINEENYTLKLTRHRKPKT